MEYRNKRQSLKSYSNPLLPFLRIFIPLALVPGVTMIVFSLIYADTIFLNIGIFALILGPFSMLAIDYFLRSRIVDLNQNEVVLIFANRKEVVIPYRNIEIQIVHGSPWMGGQRGNIMDKEKGGMWYSVSGQITDAIRSELMARGIIKAHKIIKK